MRAAAGVSERLAPWDPASFLAVLGPSPEEAQRGQDPSVFRALSLVRLGLAHLPILQGALLDAYHRAVAALDAQGAHALALQLVGGLTQVEQIPARVIEWVPQLDEAEPSGAAVRVSANNSAPVLPHESLGELPSLTEQLRQAYEAALTFLAVQLSPQVLGGQLVAEAAEPPTRGQVLRQGASLISREAGAVIELLSIAEHIAAYVLPSDGTASTAAVPQDLALAVDELERFASRPIHLFFLSHALQRRGVWNELAPVLGTRGRTAAGLLSLVERQAESTGTTADVGPRWDATRADALLGYDLTDWAITDGDAMEVIEMLRAASPQARGGLVKQLHRMDKLDRLAENVGWQHLKQLAESMSDPEAEAMLAPYWQDKGGVPSSGQFFTQQVDQNLAQDGILSKIRAFDWYFLNLSLDALSFGGKASIDDAHEARDAGRISEDAFWGEANKTMGRTLAVGAAALATGGAAGAWAEGAASALGAGASGSAIVGGAAGGAAGNVGAHFIGDVYDQILNDKEGFDSLGDYAKDFASGGLSGAVMAPVGFYASKYLPTSALTLGQLYAKRHPELIRLLEASRAAGVNAVFRVRMTLREWSQILEGGGLGPLRPAFAMAAGSADLAHLPLDTELSISARPKVDVDAPHARLGDEAEPWLDVESVEVAAPRGERWRDALGSEDPSVQGMHEIDPLGEEPHLRRLPAAKDLDPDRSPETTSSGFWEDNNARGNVPWHADNSNVNRATQYGPVEYRNGYPVYEPYSKGIVRPRRIVGSGKDNRAADFEWAKQNGRRDSNGDPDVDWAKDYREANDLMWHHHEDGQTMMLVPLELHRHLPHAGGASVVRRAAQRAPVDKAKNE